MIETRSGITIDSHDRWIYEAKEITQPSILKYFRQILRISYKGWYLDNRFGEKLEHSYIESIQGFPIHAISAEVNENEVSFQLDSDQTVNVSCNCIYSPDNDIAESSCLYFHLPETNVPVRLLTNAMVELGSALTSKGNGFIWKSGEPLLKRELNFFF